MHVYAIGSRGIGCIVRIGRSVQQLQLPAPSLPGPAQSQPPRQPVSPGGVSGSGGYFEYVFRSAARELYGVTVERPLQYKTLRNTDFKEAVLEVRACQPAGS